MMKNKIERYFPLGYNYKAEIVVTVLTYIGTSLTSAWWYFMFMNATVSDMYEYIGGEKILVENAQDYIAPFVSYLLLSMYVFAVIPVLSLALGLYHYLYHYQHSKSIYLMKRLPDRKELYIRCFSIPVFIVIIGVLIMVFLTGLYFGYYIKIIPQEFIEIF